MTPEAITENRARAVAAIMPGAALATVYQVHSSDAVIVGDLSARPRADAMATDRPGVLLGILTADCAPVLLAEQQAGVVGAAHAGWRGATGGVVEAVVAAMVALGAARDQIAAAVGPCIARESYEVDAAWIDALLALDRGNARFVTAGRDGHGQFDLEAYVAARLAAAGVGRIDRLGLDTYRDEARFFSYRRATHRGEADYGRQIALIGLETK